MHKCIVSIFFLLSISFFSIQGVEFSEIFSNLDETKISTSILYDRIIPYSAITQFTGMNNIATSNSSNWKQIYYELYNAHVIVPLLPSIYEIEDTIKDILNGNSIPIGIINMKYNLIKNHAITDSLLKFKDSCLWDGPNTSESPYSEHRCFVASALVDEVNTTFVTFEIDDHLALTNTNEQIQYFEIDFDDGNGYITLNINDVHNVDYSSYGEKTISIEAYMVDGKILVSQTTINICTPILKTSSYKNSPDNGIETIKAYYGPNYWDYNIGYYGIWYGCNNGNQLKKPVIFVEGFDPLNENTLTTNLYDIGNQNSLLDSLNKEGFDIIILDFKKGGAKIQENAMVLRALIDTINNRTKPNNELVIIGASMGGLIVRYALSYMEDNNEDHHTRLFISFDTPHQGAYVPLSAQHLLFQIMKAKNTLWLFNYSFPKILTQQFKKIDSDAAKQMLVYHCSATSNNKANPHQLRLDFINDLVSLSNNGYPQYCRKIAVSEGSGNGTGQLNLGAGTSFIDVDTITDLFSIDLNMRALSENMLDTILELDIWVKDRWGWGSLNCFNNVYIAVDNTKPYDSAPGGNMEIIKPISEGFNDIFGLGTNYQSRECFIPTISALDIRNADSLSHNILKNITNNNYTVEINDTTITPFDALFVDTTNRFHIYNEGISPKMVDWLIEQIVQDSIFIQNHIYSSKFIQYEATKTIFVGSDVCDGLNGKVIIKDSSNFTFVAGETIFLKPGFSVEEGSTFHAYIGDFGCNNLLRNAMVSFSMSNQDVFIPESVNDSISFPTDVFRSSCIKVVPNPSKGQFDLHIDLKNEQEGKVMIFNGVGKLVFCDDMDYSCTKGICLNQPPGLYLLKVLLDDNQIFTEKIIIR
jgi:hypothetical protein